jgi:hypothetical protein
MHSHWVGVVTLTLLANENEREGELGEYRWDLRDK